MAFLYTTNTTIIYKHLQILYKQFHQYKSTKIITTGPFKKKLSKKLKVQ